MEIKDILFELDLPINEELLNTYRAINYFDELRWILKMQGLGNHRFFNSDYFIIEPDEINLKDRKRFKIDTNLVQLEENIFSKINQHVNSSIVSKWGDYKAIVFALNNTDPKDYFAIAYLYENKNIYKGVYCLSLNFADEKEFLANSFQEIFGFEKWELEESLRKKGSQYYDEKIDKTRCYTYINNKVAKSKEIGFKDILKNDYVIIDSECVDNVKDYENFINDTFVKLAKEKMNFEIFELSEQSNKRTIKVSVKKEILISQLEGNTNYIDNKIVELMNKVLINNGIKSKTFIAFWDTSFGQEIGIAYLTPKKIESLKKLDTITIF